MKVKNDTVFRIRDKSTGDFFAGARGQTTWSSRGAAVSSFNSDRHYRWDDSTQTHIEDPKFHDQTDYELIPYELVEKKTDATDTNNK